MIEFYFVSQSFAFHILHFCFCKYQQKLFQQSISLKVSSVFVQHQTIHFCFFLIDNLFFRELSHIVFSNELLS